MLKFRPHHFLCALGFSGKGYSAEFIENFQEIVDQLNGERGDDVKILVTRHADSICAPCPHLRGVGCETQGKIDALDSGHERALAIQEGCVISWQEARKKIREKISLEVFEEVCAPCSWKKMGICEAALKKEILKGEK